MHHSSQGSALASLPQHCQDIRVTVTHVDDERQVSLLRQSQMTIEVLLLQRKGCVIPISIEPCLTECANGAILCQLGNLIPIVRLSFGDVVRLDADGSEHIRMSL